MNVKAISGSALALAAALLGSLALVAAGPFGPKTERAAAAGSESFVPPASPKIEIQAGQAIGLPGPAGPIADRLAKARAEARSRGWTRGFWFGYGIRRLMGEHSSMGWYPRGGPERHLTLDDLINGRKTPLEKKVTGDQALRGTTASMPEEASAFAARRDGDEPERAVMKDVGILFRLGPEEAAFPADIRISNLDLPFDLEGLPLLWGGAAADRESLDLLIPLYAKAAAAGDKRSLLWAIGLHRDAGAVIPFIGRVLAGRETDEVRAEAVSCLGEQNDARALDLLLGTIKSDPSREVKQQAVGALVELELPAAAEALISLASQTADRPVREEAVRGLAEKANPSAVQALIRIAGSDKDKEIRDEAIHAMAELPGRSGLPHLVTLARTHADREVRTEAVAAIGEVGGTDAVRRLTELARGRGR